MNLKQYKEKLLQDPGFKKEYYKFDLGMEISLMIQEARMLAGITQEELAKRVGTRQPSIARLENSKFLPSLGFLQKIAKALDTYLIPPKMGIIEDFNKLSVENKVENSKTIFTSVNSFAGVPVYLLSQNTSSMETYTLPN